MSWFQSLFRRRPQQFSVTLSDPAPASVIHVRTAAPSQKRQLENVRKRYSAIAAANTQAPGGWTGVRSNRDDDALNREYAEARGDVIQRSQDLDVNNPDLGGWNRTRVAQILGRGVKFKHAPRPDEIDLDAATVATITHKVNRLRELHSKRGGFDYSGNNRSEGMQQQRAMLTTLINGDCLIHRVYRDGQLLPLSLELVPGVRISTPLDRQGDPLISYGIEYEDDTRSRVVGYHVRRASKTIGDSFTPNFEWDFIPIEDAALMSITEQAGIDRALPASVRVARMLRNRGEFLESAVESARAQAGYYVDIECAPNANPFDVAGDDATEVSAMGTLFTQVSDGVRAMFHPNGETATWNAAKLPDPDFTGFIDKTDERLARGLGSSKSIFTRAVSTSFAGGRLEQQQDDPVIDQLRELMVQAWQKVNDWFLEAVWLEDAVDLPGYNLETQPYWAEFTATFPGKVHLNPVQTMDAREKALMLRLVTPQELCEEDGKDLAENLRKFAQAEKMRIDVENEFELEAGTLAYLISGKSISTSAGQDIVPPPPVDETEETDTTETPPLRLAGSEQ